MQIPNLQLNNSYNKSIALNLHLINNYQRLVAIILFLDSKYNFNLRAMKKEYLVNDESSYYLSSNNTSFFNKSYALVNPEFFNNLNFFNKKSLITILDQNLNLSKQNR
jgi:hypothetical protein